ncbi:MAG: DUF1631 family protein [Hydrogenophilaceae bacterium]|nr:DUF1631 family protein [Hydrogenophilaceae bacterium]
MQESNLNYTTPEVAGLIGRCRDGAVACLPSALSVTLGDALNGLIEARPWVGPDSAIELYEQTIGVLRHRRGDLEAAFRERLVVLSDPARHQAGQAGSGHGHKPVAQAGLMDEDLHYDFAAPDTLAQAVATACKSELYSLDRRFDSISGARAWRELPIGPQVIGLAMIEAMRQVGLARPIRQALLPLLAEYLPRQVKPVYQMLNQFLAERTILPEMKLGLPAKGQAGTVAAVCQNWLMRQSLAQPTTSIAGEVVSDLTLGQALAGLQRGDAHAAGLLGLNLEESKTDSAVLRRIEQATTLRLSAADKVVLDWTAALFETKVFTTQLPDDWQTRIGRLQLLTLQAALLDADGVMRRPEHPVRRLVDALLVLASGEAGQSVASKAQVAALIEALQLRGDDLIEGFREALATLPVLPQAASASVAAKAARSADAVDAERAIRKAIDGRRIPGAMEAFLHEHWAAVSCRADAVEAETALHELVASLEPAGWRHRRAELAASLPGLLKRLKSLLACAGISGEVRDKFFNDLVKCHALLMRATQTKPAENKADPESKVA